MKINQIILEKRESKDQRMNDAGEIVGKTGKLLSKHPFIDDQVAVFHGPNSKSWDHDMVKLARKLEKSGVARNQIWQKTGVFRNPNGDWRMEINDYNMKVKQIPKAGRALRLGDVIDHPELFKAYPHLKKMPIKGYRGNENELNMSAMGYYLPAEQSISIRVPYGVTGRNQEQWARTLVHELQHAIQAIEKPISNKFRGDDERIKQQLAKAGIHQMDYDIYLSYWKEVDARQAADRMQNTPEFNKTFVPTPDDTEYWQVDKDINPFPGGVLADHPSKYPEYYKSLLSIKNPFFGTKPNMAPFQDPDYNKGNNKGGTDQSNDNQLRGRNSRYRNKPGDRAGVIKTPVQKPTPVVNQPKPSPVVKQPAPPVVKQPAPVKKPKPAPTSNPGDKAGVNKPKGTK